MGSRLQVLPAGRGVRGTPQARGSHTGDVVGVEVHGHGPILILAQGQGPLGSCEGEGGGRRVRHGQPQAEGGQGPGMKRRGGGDHCPGWA